MKMSKQIPWIVTVLIGLIFSVEGCASTPVKGTITATQTCEAYVSKNKRTNPDNSKLIIDKKYEIFEQNRPSRPGWYRVKVPGANPSKRWVAKHCGTISLDGGSSDSDDGGRGQCHTAGLQDSYKLALSWQPAFCETHRGKPECRIDDKKSYQARNFTLHGLWPNKKSCGTKYNYCGDVTGKPGHFCDYPALSLITDVRSDLEHVMPSAKAGSCLQRHEWHKHGTCQTNWSIDEYHEVAVDLTRQFNESGVAYFISRNIGKTVQEETFNERVDCALGENAHKRLKIKCKNGNLVDIYINLPKSISRGDSLRDILKRAAPDSGSSCNGEFRIDPIGFQ